ncbi:D-glycero-beta-D-manno-heptose-7-phosphate kinase [Variovorax sp. PCZ-1]|uniref:D-glycero-beta-D-manno-heptose-7-phosphate kinase n=1 Tax=Variovorax sp. PCZ-1 TaxID=2835533 RepID=UPI0032DFE53E
MTISREQLSQASVLVVGDAMLDRYWYGDVERISPEAPVPVVHVKRDEERMGAAANVAANVVSLGAQASFIGVVGADEAGRKLQTLLEGSGITSHLALDERLQTTVKLRVIGRAQQLLRLDFETPPTHDALAVQAAVFAERMPLHGCVLFSDYAKGSLAYVAPLIAASRQAGKPILIDPKGSDYSRYAGATAITPNRSDLRAVVGSWHSEDELRSKAQNLRTQLNLEAIVLTRSEEGITVFDAAGDLTVSTQAREVYDVTGAGDTVIATLAALLAAGMTLRDALPHANKAGAVVVGKFGTATVSFEEVFGHSPL